MVKMGMGMEASGITSVSDVDVSINMMPLNMRFTHAVSVFFVERLLVCSS